MCGGGGGDNGTDEYAEQQRMDQSRRERRVRSGMTTLKRLFEGGTRGINPDRSFNRHATYYNSGGNLDYNPDSKSARRMNRAIDEINPDNFDEDTSIGEDRMNEIRSYQNRRQQHARRAKDGLYFRGREQVEGFDDDFYNERSQAYLDYANPEADKQYGDALEDLTFALARAGTLNSSTGADRHAEVEQQHDDARRHIADAAGDQATRARQAVSDERSRLTQLIHATGDPGSSLAGVGDVLQNLRANPVYDPVGPIFQNVTAGIGNYVQGRRYADMNQRLNDMFRTPNDGSARTVN